MSVTSVRNAINKATADHNVTYSEAQEIVRIAGRTSGINAGERAELTKAIASPDFDSFSKSVLQRGIIRSTPNVPAPAAMQQAVTQLLKQHGLDALSGLKTIDTDKLPQPVLDACERFSALLNQNDGDTVSQSARELKVGREKVIVVNDFNGNNKELFGFFDHQGREIARAMLTRTEEKISVQWQHLDGKAGAMIATYSNGGEKVPASLKKDLVKFLKARAEADEDIGGKDVKAKDMPSPIRQHYEFMERNTPDGVGADVLQFEGKKLFVLHDYSCVTSDYYYTAKGTLLTTATDGEING